MACLTLTNLLLASDVLLGKVETGKKVLIAGGGMIGVETADFLAEHGREVSIIEMFSEVGRDVNMVVKVGLFERLKNYGVKFITNAEINKFNSNGVVYKQEGVEKEIGGFDSIVLSLGTVSYNPLSEKLKDKVKEIYVIGDADKAGKVFVATTEAAKLAISI